MGFSLNIGKSKSKSSTSAASTSTTTAKKFDAGSKTVLDDLMTFLQGGLPAAGGQFSRENAITDSNALVKSLFDQFQTTALPQIAMGMQGAGVYNATAGQQLANDAFGKTTAAASQAVMQNIQSYAKLAQEDKNLTLNGLLNVLGLQKEAYGTQTTNEVGTSTTKNSGTAAGFGVTGK